MRALCVATVLRLVGSIYKAQWLVLKTQTHPKSVQTLMSLSHSSDELGVLGVVCPPGGAHWSGGRAQSGRRARLLIQR